MGADQHIDWQTTAASALDWWHEAGVDTLVDEMPRRWLDAVASARAPAPAPSEPAAAALPESLAEFEAWRISAAAPDSSWGKPIAPHGAADSGLMVLLDMPEREDAASGQLLSGEAGRLFDRMLAAIGRDRQSAYIANVIPWRPPGNRTPTPIETEICRPFIERQIELVNPKVLVNLGGPSAKTLLNTTEGILRLRGNWREHVTPSGTAIPAMPTLHPAYLLRTPAHKRLAWRDFLEVKTRLRSLQG